MADEFTLEQLFMSLHGFQRPDATPVQRAICRIADGVPLAELAEDADVRQAVGGDDAVEALRKMEGVRPTEVYVVGPIRGGKSLLLAAATVKATQTIDVSRLGHGERARISLLSLKLDLEVVLDHIVGNALASPYLRPLLASEPSAERVEFYHPSGAVVEVVPVATMRAGGAALSRWSGGVVVDEWTRQAGTDDSVRNWPQTRRGVLGRLLPGAQIFGAGAPGGPAGPAYELFQRSYGRPSRHCVIVRATGPMMNPSWWTPERCADLEARDHEAYRCDVLSEFGNLESGMFAADLLSGAQRDEPDELPPEDGLVYASAMDPATRTNSWGFAIATFKDGRYHVVLVRQWTPKGTPLSPAAVLKEIASICARYRIAKVRTDGWSADALSDIARPLGLTIDSRTMTTAQRTDLYSNLETHLRQGACELPPSRDLYGDLLSIKKRTTQAGVMVILPKSSDGRHCDLAPPTALSVAAVGEALAPQGGTATVTIISPAETALARVTGGSTATLTATNGEPGDLTWPEFLGGPKPSSSSKPSTPSDPYTSPGGRRAYERARGGRRF